MIYRKREILFVAYLMLVMVLCSCNKQGAIKDYIDKIEDGNKQESSNILDDSNSESETTTIKDNAAGAIEDTTIDNIKQEETTSAATSGQSQTITEQQQTTLKPAEITTNQSQTTKNEQPTTTKQPQTTTKQPQTTTRQPQTTTKEPQTTTKEPQTTTKKPQETTTSKPNVEVDTTPVIYTVNVKTKGGMVLEDVGVYVYEDNTHKVLKDYKTPNSSGIAEFSLKKSSNYSIVLKNVPAGYDVKTSYSFDGTTANIELASSVIKGQLPQSLGLGDVMYDVTFTDPNGVKHTISEILKEKDMVVLNFWYANCYYCIQEFPYLDEVYGQYKDSVEVLAINPVDQASNIDYVKDYYGLSFPMTACGWDMPQAFGVTGYPTTVIIDRYGVICMVESGGRPYTWYWEMLFEHFTASDYEQKILYDGVYELY